MFWWRDPEQKGKVKALPTKSKGKGQRSKVKVHTTKSKGQVPRSKVTRVRVSLEKMQVTVEKVEPKAVKAKESTWQPTMRLPNMPTNLPNCKLIS